jgi:hypothetical protein
MIYISQCDYQRNKILRYVVVGVVIVVVIVIVIVVVIVIVIVIVTVTVIVCGAFILFRLAATTSRVL